MSSNGPPRNYYGALKTNLKTCAKGTKLRVYNEFVVVNITSKDHITLQCVMFMLQNHEQRIESCESTTQVDVNGASAHYAAKENSFNFGYNRGNDNYHGRPCGSQGGGG